MSSPRTSTSLANQVVFSVILVGYSVTNITSTVLIWLRRHKHPLKGRHPRFLLLFNIIALVITTIVCINAILPEEIPCLFVNTNMYSWYFSSYSIRAFVLWFQFEHVQEALQHQHSTELASSSTKSLTRDPLWFSKRMYLISEKYTLMYAFATFLFCFASVPFLFASGECNSSGTLTRVVSVFNNLILMAIGVFLGFKLRKEFDLFWLRQELKYNSACCVTGLIFWIGLPFLYYKPEEFYATSLIAVCVTTAFLIFSSVIPLWLSYKAERESNSRSRGRNSSRISASCADDKKADELINILEDPEGYKLLEKYLAGEFAVENITFYKVCRDFQEAAQQESADKTECIQKAWEIYNMYMKSNAPQEINISLASKDLIKTRILEMKNTAESSDQQQNLIVLRMLFDESLKEVLRLIATDSFLRFKRQPEAQTFLKKKAASNALSSMELI